jgi:hypothetical protein
LKVSLFVLALVSLLLPAAVSAQQTFTGGAIAVGRTQTTPSSSTATISSPTGSSIATIKIVLNGLTTDGTACTDGNCWSLLPTSFYLQSPHGGPKLVLLGGTGDGIDGDDQVDPGSGLNNATITIQDGNNPAPNGTPWTPKTGTFTVEPSSYFLGAGQTPPLGSEADFPQTDGGATFNSRFGGIGIANGDVWTLTIQNGEGLTTPINISSWEMIVTYATTTSTSTAVSSSQNPAFTTSPNNSVTFTATVTPASGPTGTVAFTDNGTTISGCGAVALSGGVAHCLTTTLAQGYHVIEATYGGGGGYGQSSGSVTQLIEVHPTQSGNTWCNNTSFTAPLNETSIVYPAVIPVSGYGAGSTVGNVTIELQNVTEGAPGAGIDAEFLLVAPGGANNLDFLDEAFNTEASGAVNLFISDSGSNTPNQGTPVNNDTYIPYDGETNSSLDIFPASNSPIVDSNIPLVPGTINFAAPHGKTNSLTLQQAFNGAPANGDWALYATAWNGSDALTVGGWCVTLDVNSGVGTTTSLSSTQQDAYKGTNITLTATVTVQGSSTPVTSGTVEFKDETTGTVLASANTLDGSGVATVSVSNLAEGDHKILASYSGTGSFNTSFASLYQRIDDATAVTAVNSNTWQFCNTGAITIAEGSSGAETPNPSNIFVANLPGTLNTATLTLNNFSILVGDQLDNTESLVVGPTGKALDFFSNTADGTIGDEALAGNYTFADSASGLVSSGSGNLNPGTYRPTSYVGTDSGTDVFTADPGGFYTLPGTFGYSASRGSSTFANEFSGTNPIGAWSLYFNSPNANLNGTGAAGGWCLNLTETLPTISQPDLSHLGNFAQGESNAQYTVALTNSGTTGPTGDPTGTNPMKVTDVLNSAFTYASGSGSGWSCSATGQTVTCTNDSAVADNGGTYPTLTINVNVSGTATGTITNQITAAGAGVASITSNTDSVTIAVPPVITSANHTTFTAGTAGSFTVTATGSPAPTFTESGVLPSGVTLSSAGVLSGIPNANSGGTYVFTITASNGTTDAMQTFTLTVNQAPTITSANNATFTVGTAGSFSVTASAFPGATFGETGPLPNGLTFTSGGVLSGTPNATSGNYPITITASNGIGSNATQSFTITVNPGAATHLVIPGGPEPFYTAFGFTITAEDAAGNVATSYNGTVAFTSSDPGFVNLGPITLVNGQGTQTGVLKTAGTDSITATDTTNSSITGTGFFTIQPGVATHIGLAAPASAYVGSPISVTLTAYDLYGNVATSYGGTVAFTSSDPSAVLPGSSAITNGTGTFSATMETVGAQTITATDAGNSLSASTANISVTLPALVVTTAADDAGTASNCTIQTTPGTGTDASCSLRDALLFAANEGSGSITFDSTAFAAAQTITLSNGTLTIPSNTVINGPTSGTGATLTNLVTVNGSAASSVFTVGSSAIGDGINWLIVTNGSTGTSGGGVSNFNGGTLTINNSTISGNSANGGFGGGIANTGTLTLNNSTISGNSASTGQGSGIFNTGTLTITNSTIAGNAAAGGVGGGIMNTGGGTLTVNDSTISGNSATGGGGIYGIGTTVNLANTIVSGNTADADIDGSITDNGGNQTGVTGINLAALGSYGGPTQTMPALPGSPAICFGTLTNWTAASLTADQRGFALLSTYCPAGSVDSGAVQTNYALVFSTEPPATSIPTLTLTPNPVVALTESGVVAAGGTGTVSVSGSPVALTGTGSGSLSSGSVTFSNLAVPTAATNETLTATFALTSSLNLTAQSSQIQVAFPAPPALTSPAPGSVLGTTNVTFSWTPGPSVYAYDLYLGTSLGALNLYNSGGVSTTSVTVPSIPADGLTVYARLFYQYQYLGPWQSIDYTYTESPSLAPTMSSPTPGTVLGTSNVAFSWTPGAGVTAYDLYIGTGGAGSANLYNSTATTTTSFTAPTLPSAGDTVNVRLWYKINGTWQFTDYTYTESPSAAPAMSSPTPGTVIGASNVTFSWTPGAGVTQYDLYLGTAAGLANLYNSAGVTTTSVTVPAVPALGQTVFARLWFKINGVWQSTDYTYTESPIVNPTLTSPTPGAVLGTSNVVFSWTSGAGVSAYDLYLGTTAGSANLYNSAAVTTTSVTVPTLPSKGAAVFARLWYRINGVWQFTDYNYTER